MGFLDYFNKNKLVAMDREGKLTQLPNYPEKDFVYDTSFNLMANIAAKLVVKARGTDDVFKFSQPGLTKDKLIGISYNLHKIIIHTFLNTDKNGLFIARYADKSGNSVYLPCEEKDFKTQYPELRKKGFEITSGTTLLYPMTGMNAINQALSIVYDSILTIKSNILRSNFEVFKKKGLNAMYQNANPVIADKVDKMLNKQLTSIQNGQGVVIDADDDYGFLQHEVNDMKDKFDYVFNLVAVYLGLPVNEVTGQQYTSTLGSRGAESIDVQKAKAKYNFLWDIFKQALDDLGVEYMVVALTIDEAIGVAREVAAVKAYETNPAIIKRCDDIILEALNGYVI